MKRYKEALTSFRRNEQNGKVISDMAINQVLKSCTNVKDLAIGSDIHSRYWSRIENNSYSLASLIHFYGKY